MPGQLVSLYPPERIIQLKWKIKALRILLWVLAAAALTACVVLTCCANTANSSVMMLWTMGISTVAGWIVLYLAIFGVGERKKELAHASHLMEGEQQAVTGTVRVDPQRMRLRKSITVQKVFVRTPEGERSFLVNAARAEELRRAGENLTLCVSHGYVAAYEVCP